jgi:hypothetical protein
LDENLIDRFEEDSNKLSEYEDKEKDELITNHDEILKQRPTIDGLFDSDEEELEEKTEKLEKDFVSCDNSSFVTDKYMEDLNAQTVANKFSDMILSLEQPPEEEELCNPGSEQAFYVEDEIYMSDMRI